MSEQPIYLTPEGAARLRAELESLKGPQREALSRRLREAIQMGDLSENADYHKAKEDQGFLEGRIQELERLLHDAVIKEIAAGIPEMVDIGCRVTIQEEDYEPEVYTVVGAKEANPRSGKISYESPIGKAIMGKRAGDEAIAYTPAGKLHLKILSVDWQQ